MKNKLYVLENNYLIDHLGKIVGLAQLSHSGGLRTWPFRLAGVEDASSLPFSCSPRLIFPERAANLQPPCAVLTLGQAGSLANKSGLTRIIDQMGLMVIISCRSSPFWPLIPRKNAA